MNNLRFSDGNGNVLSPFVSAFAFLSDLLAADIIDERLSVLDTESFAGCQSLSSVTASAVSEIGSGSFRGCPAMTSLSTGFLDREYAESFYREWCVPAGCSVILGDGTVVPAVSGMFAFFVKPSTCGVSSEDGTWRIKAYSMAKAGSSGMISSLIFDESVRWNGIEPYAFIGCSSLTSIVLPDGIKDIGIGCFAGCVGLSSVTLPSGLSSIRDYAFDEVRDECSVAFLDPALSGCKSLFEYGLRAKDIYEGGRIPISTSIDDACRVYMSYGEIAYLSSLFLSGGIVK